VQGCLLHLTAIARTRITVFSVDSKSWKRDGFHEVIYIDRTGSPANINPTKPKEWAVALYLHVSKRIVSVMNTS